MGLLNRSALMRPRKPYLLWAKEDDSSGVAESVYEEMRSNPIVFLISEDEDAEGADGPTRAVVD